MSTWSGIEQFRKVLAEYGHPQDRIDWLAGLVSTPGLGEPIWTFELDTGRPELPPRTRVLQWNPDKTESTIRLQLRRADFKISYWAAPLSVIGKFAWRSWESTFFGNYQTLGTLVWQDALRTLGITEAAND